MARFVRNVLTLLALGFLAHVCPPARGYADEPRALQPRARFFESNGVKLFYQDEGSGEPVVLLHGFTINGRINWDLPGITRALSRDHRVLTLDARGHGRSEKPHDPAKYGIEMVEDVVRLLDHLKIEKAHIVGYSMGGFITNKLVTTHPERVLTATQGGAGWGRTDDKPSFLDDLAVSLEQGKGITPLLIALHPPDSLPLDEDELKFANRMLTLTNDQKALAALIRGTTGLSVPKEKLLQNRVPVLAIVGERDPMKVGVDAMDGVMSNLKIVVIRGGDHMSTFYDPQFVRSLREFLAAHHARPLIPAAAE